MTADPRPLIAHVIYRLQVGGLENGLVNLLNHLPEDRFRHAVVVLTEATDFAQRIRRKDVTVHALDKREGHDTGVFGRFRRLLRDLRPDIVHTRNLAALELQPVAWQAGIRGRVHSEHGWDTFDPDGRKRRYRLIRRLSRLFVQRYIPLSQEIETYLVRACGIPRKKITRIYNGVDLTRFRPDPAARGRLPFGADPGAFIVGTVGRMHGVKDQITLARAFVHARQRDPALRLRLVMLGEGPLRADCLGVLRNAGCAEEAWLPGERDDVADILPGLDLFVLPSRAEGISNTVLEAMACGVPVVATAVGGNPELVADRATGRLVAPRDPQALAGAIVDYARDPALARSHGAAGRARAAAEFALDRMVARYADIYGSLLKEH